MDMQTLNRRSAYARQDKARGLHELRHGITDLADAMGHAQLGKMYVLDLLTECPEIGETRAERIVELAAERAKVPAAWYHGTPVRALSPRLQRYLLGAAIDAPRNVQAA